MVARSNTQKVADFELMSALRARHADTLGGRLSDLEEVAPAVVELTVSARSARTHSGQHLAWYLANLLGRLEGVVGEVRITIEDVDAAESGCELLPNVDPRRPEGCVALSQALAEVVHLAAPHRVVRIGSPQPPAAWPPSLGARIVRVRIGRVAENRDSANAQKHYDVYTSANGWTAYVGRSEGPECSEESELAFGAHVAAAFAAAEVFRMLRARGDLASGPRSLFFSAWSLQAVSSFESAGSQPAAIVNFEKIGIGPVTLAGVGAVGCAFLLTLWAAGIPATCITAIDGDHVSSTNLNRYVLFGVQDLGRPKASCAANILHRSAANPFVVLPSDRWWAEHIALHTAPIELLVSAVDKNTVRHQLQDALPRVILGGSTNGLRAEVSRYDLALPDSRCLKCNNPPELVETDESLRLRLAELGEQELVAEAEDRDVSVATLRRFVEEIRAGRPGCATLSGPELEKLRRRNGEGMFAVSFVSALAGALLAAQTAREASEVPSALTPPLSRGNVQLWRPAAPVNSPQPATVEPGCWCQQPLVRATAVELAKGLAQ